MDPGLIVAIVVIGVVAPIALGAVVWAYAPCKNAEGRVGEPSEETEEEVEV